MGEDGGRHDTALPIPAPAPAPASAGVTENGASSVPNASVPAARPPARDAEQVRGNLGSTALDHPQQQQQRQGRPAASIAAPPRYVAPFFAQAAQPEIIRANQKDLYYLLQLTDQLEEVVRGLFGTRWLQTFSTEVGLASQIAYYGLTTLLGSQTLGEEYVDILQYSSRTRKIPTLLTRSLLLFSHILAPYFLAKAYGQIKRRIAASRASDALRERVPTDAQVLFDSTTTADEDNLFSDEPARAVAAQPAPAPISSVQPVTSRLPLASLFSSIELPHLESLLDEHLRAIHLAVFYLVGRYYQVSKRLLGVRYLSMQNKAEGAKPPSYEVLGVLMTLQLGVRLLAYAYRRRKQAKEAARQAEKEVKEKLEGAGHEHKQRQPALVDGEPISALLFDPEDPSSGAAGEAEEEFEPVEARRCTLCLGPRKDPAATECGHCFCYTCIVAWTREKPECPLCRSRVKLSKILPLYHV